MQVRRRIAIGAGAASFAAVAAGAIAAMAWIGRDAAPAPAGTASEAPPLPSAVAETAAVPTVEPPVDSLSSLLAAVLPTASAPPKPAPAAVAKPIAKVDRLPMPPAPKLAAAAVKPSEPRRPSSDGGITITTTLPDGGGTVAMPILAYASLEAPTATPFDKLIVPAQPGLAAVRPQQPIEAPPVAEEDDDVVELLPLPRPKPKGPLVAHADPGMPMPPPLKPALPPLAAKPGTPVDLAAKGLPPLAPPAKPLDAPTPPSAAAAVPAPPPAQRNTILALFTPQPEASVPAPGAGVVTKTPFGVPYVLQTESVDTACLRPDLVDILRKVESHYGKKVVVTSGYRDRGRPGSLHRRCAAADIIVPGVSSQALVAFARTIPGVGGVGQYCHQSMVHVDVGTPRDWKYGCGSYFAMRDGSAGWGRKPSSQE